VVIPFDFTLAYHMGAENASVQKNADNVPCEAYVYRQHEKIRSVSHQNMATDHCAAFLPSDNLIRLHFHYSKEYLVWRRNAFLLRDGSIAQLGTKA
jgi:hypothetical protein